MFGLFRSNPLKKLKSQYAQKLEEARDQQRKGDIKRFAEISSEADALLQQIESLEASPED